MVIDLDKLNLTDPFEARYERARDVVKCAVRLAIPGEVNIHPAVAELHFLIACKTIADQGKSLIPFDITGTLEELVEDGIDQLL